jgi:hypothetical protein
VAAPDEVGLELADGLVGRLGEADGLALAALALLLVRRTIV